MLFTAANKDLGTGAAYAYTTNWDANMIYGCTCDPGWEGYDCSLRELAAPAHFDKFYLNRCLQLPCLFRSLLPPVCSV